MEFEMLAFYCGNLIAVARLVGLTPASPTPDPCASLLTSYPAFSYLDLCAT